MSERETQNELILKYLQQPGNSLTPLTALFEPFRCMRLGARCWELKKAGHNIISKRVELPNGKRVVG